MIEFTELTDGTLEANHVCKFEYPNPRGELPMGPLQVDGICRCRNMERMTGMWTGRDIFNQKWEIIKYANDN